MTTRTLWLDRTGATLSGLCLIHCLLLPVLAVSLPFLGLLAEAEWLHRGFVLAAIPIAAMVFLRPQINPARHYLRVVAISGLLFLLLGAFVEALHDYEVLLTVIGAISLAFAHIVHSRIDHH